MVLRKSANTNKGLYESSLLKRKLTQISLTDLIVVYKFQKKRFECKTESTQLMTWSSVNYYFYKQVEELKGTMSKV